MLGSPLFLVPCLALLSAVAQVLPPIRDDVEDELLTPPQLQTFSLPTPASLEGHLLDRWNLSDRRCCSPPLAPLVVDTHIHVWDQDVRPNRRLNQLGLLEDVLTEGWGEGVDLGVLVQPGFRGANNSYILRSLRKFPGTLAGEVEHVKDYRNSELKEYHEAGIRGLRFKATSLQKYEELVTPRLRSRQFDRIAKFLLSRKWHWGVQLAKEVFEKWPELLAKLQETQVPIIIDMFGRPDPLVPAGAFPGTLAILEAARKPPPAGKIWMELGAPFRVDPRCTYAEPEAADPSKCLPEDRVKVPRRGGVNETAFRTLCCPPKTHQLLIELAALFLKQVGEDFVVWGTDWPFITDVGVTVNGLLDVMALWVPNVPQRQRVLGVNAVRDNAVGEEPLFPLIHRVTQKELESVGEAHAVVLDTAVRQPIPVQDAYEDQPDLGQPGSPSGPLPPAPPQLGLVPRWKEVDKRCCSSPLAPLVVDTHVHIWDEDPRPNRGFNQLGLLEDNLVEGWGVGVHLAILVQPGFRLDNNTYITRSLEHMPGRLAGEVEAIIDYDDQTLKQYHDLGVRGLRFKATSLLKYQTLVEPRLVSAEFPRIANFMRQHAWHWGVQLAQEVGEKWAVLLRTLQDTRIPVIVDMFGRPDPAAAIDIGTQAIVEAAQRPPPAGKIWMELGGPFRVDPRCTYAEPEAADPARCAPQDRVNITRRGGGAPRPLCCPPRTHELFISLSRLFATVVGQDYLLWGTDWPFISDTGVTTRGLLDAVASWLSWDEKLLFKVLGTNALRPDAINGFPLFPLLDLRKRPPLRVAGVFSSRRQDDAWAFLHAVEEANTQLVLPVVLEAVLHWQNDTDNPLEYLQTACRIVEAGIFAVVGPPSSTQTAAMQNIFSPLGLPVVGTSASDPTLRRFPNFLRMVPGDDQQSLALAAVMKHFQWLRVATVYQMDSYGENGLEAFWSWSLQANGDVLRIPVPLSASEETMRHLLQTVKTKLYKIIVANVCCDLPFIARLASVANELALFSEGYFWLFTDGVTGFMDTGALQEVMPAVGQRAGLFGVIVDGFVDKDFEERLTARFPSRDPGRVSIFTATAYDGVFAMARAMTGLPSDAFDVLSEPQKCLGTTMPERQGRILSAHSASEARQAASKQTIEAVRRQSFKGVSGQVDFNGEGSRINQRFKVLNVQRDGSVQRFGSVAADSGILSLETDVKPVFLGPTDVQPSDAPARELAGPGLLGIAILTLVPTCLLLGCWCELLRFMGRALEASPDDDDRIERGVTDELEPASKQQLLSEALPCYCPQCCAGPLSGLAARILPTMQELVGELEPCHGFPPPTIRRPIVGDFIAGSVKAIIELVGCLTFAALMAPDELQPMLPVFLNYALFGFIVSQVYYNLVSRYMTPARTCNISAVIFFLEVLATCKTDLAGLPNELEVTVNTLLMAATMTTWLSGAILWVVGTFKLTSFVRYLSEPVKLGMQVSLGYFLFATGFSISTGISWLNFTTLAEFGVYFELATLPKWTLTIACAGFIFYALNKWGWPYTIPTFVGVGIGVFHLILLAGGISKEQAKEAGWLYPPPASSETYNPFGFIARIYSVDSISWLSLRKNLPAIGTAALVAPFLSAIINLILFETTFTAEEFGKSSLSFELRMDGLTQWLLAAVGGFSTSPSCGGTAVHRKIGARSNWGLFSSCGVHTAFLLIPGSTDVLQFVPKYVVGAVSLIVAISLLDSGLRGGYSKLSKREYRVVCMTMLLSIVFGIEAGIAGGWVLSFLLFIGEVAATAPVRLDVDAGLVSSHVVWGTRSARIVAQLRGAVRMLNFQGVLFFAATQPTLKDAERKHLTGDNKTFFLILDFSSVSGMDDSSPFEFKNFMAAAKKVGVCIVFSGCAPKLLQKLKKVGAVPENESSVELADGQDLLPAAQQAAESSGIDGWRLYTVGSADRAVEFCEMALAIKTTDLCKEVVPKPTRELDTLASLLEVDLASFRCSLEPGQCVERKDGDILILTDGAMEAVAELREATSGKSARPEIIVVYRTLPRLDKDYCLCGSTPGTLRAISDSVIVRFPTSALSEMRRSDRWADVETLWSQLAEFMAESMHPMAMKATMQDVRGAFSSGAAEAFAEAVLEHRQAEGWSPVSDAASAQNQKNFLRRLFLGGGARLRELRQTISVNLEGRRPIFGSVQEAEPTKFRPRTSSRVKAKKGEVYFTLEEEGAPAGPTTIGRAAAETAGEEEMAPQPTSTRDGGSGDIAGTAMATATAAATGMGEVPAGEERAPRKVSADKTFRSSTQLDMAL